MAAPSSEWYTSSMSNRIEPTEDQQRILNQEAGPIYFGQSHIILQVGDVQQLFDDYLRRELQIGFDQADAGDVAPWDIEKTIAEARLRHADKTA